MPDRLADAVDVTIDGRAVRVPAGVTVLAAVMTHQGWAVRTSVVGGARGPLCGMGICHECRVMIDGVAHERSCMALCRDGMVIRTDRPAVSMEETRA